MKNYVYCFNNYNDEIIYIGKTTRLKRRMEEHFKNGHLPNECYQNVMSVYYADTGESRYDGDIVETLLINKHKPVYNTDKVYNESSDKAKYKLPELKWERLYVNKSVPEFQVSTNPIKPKVYDTKESDINRIQYILDYNINNIDYNKGFYDYYFSGLTEEYPELPGALRILCSKTGKAIIKDESDIDEPLTECNGEDYCTYAAYDISKVELSGIYMDSFTALLRYGFTFRISGNIYAVPMLNDNNAKVIANKYDIVSH